MHQRVRLVLIGVFACLFAAFAGVWIAAVRGGDEPAQAQDRATGYSGSLRPAGARVPAFRLTDQDGRTVTPGWHAGKPALYAFIYSHCDDVCPIEVQQIRGALDQLGHDIPVLGVSVDPANDTRGSARAFLLAQHMTGRMRFAMGSPRQLAPVWKAFGIQPQTDGKEHSASVVLVDADGRQRLGYAFSFLRVDGLEADLRKLGA